MTFLGKLWRYFTGYFWVDLGEAWHDFRKIGLGFAIAGLKVRFLRTSAITVTLPKTPPVKVRPADSDFETLRQIFRDGGYGALPDHVMAAARAKYRAILAEGKVPVIVDAGANIGAAALWFKQMFPEAAVVAVEPEAANAALARANLAPCPGIELLEAAIGGEAGFVSIQKDGASYGAQTERADSGCEIVTIADCVRRVPNGDLFIAKIDIEGFEQDLFASNVGWLDEVFLAYVEPHEWMLPGRRSSASFQRAFGQRDFALHLSGENVVYVRNPVEQAA